jgi:hypothetical protein
VDALIVELPQACIARDHTRSPLGSLDGFLIWILKRPSNRFGRFFSFPRSLWGDQAV